MPPAERQARLAELLRHRAGNQPRLEIARLLQQAPSGSWLLLPQSESDTLIDQVLSTVGSVRRAGLLDQELDLSETDLTARIERATSSRTRDDKLLVLLSDAPEIGVIELELHTVVQYLVSLLKFDQDSIIVSNRATTWGLIAQRTEATSGDTYELEHWHTGSDDTPSPTR